MLSLDEKKKIAYNLKIVPGLQTSTKQMENAIHDRAQAYSHPES
jgi:hypothetical protein